VKAKIIIATGSARKLCSGRDLAEGLAKAKLPKETAAAWRRDLQTARKSLKTPTSKW
jgi:enoyl-CoA hydratase/carnithine racemase